MAWSTLILIGVCAIFLVLAVVLGRRWRDWTAFFGLVGMAATVGVCGLVMLTSDSKRASEADRHNEQLMTLLRLAESAQMRYAPAHEGRFSTSMANLIQLEPRLVQPLANQNIAINIELSDDRRSVVMTAAAALLADVDDDVEASVFKSTLRAGIGQRPVRGCHVQAGRGCDSYTWR